MRRRRRGKDSSRVKNMVALPKDPDLILSTHVMSTRGLIPLFHLTQALHKHTVHRPTHREDTHTHKKIKIKEEKRQLCKKTDNFFCIKAFVWRVTQ